MQMYLRVSSFPSVKPGKPASVRPARALLRTRACGAEGPFSGRRRPPSPREERREEQLAQYFELKTTAQMYEEFPYAVKVSVPLRLEDCEPAGQSAQKVPDAGPASGRRRRPGVVDAEGMQRPPALPHPADGKRELKKELMLRTHILLG